MTTRSGPVTLRLPLLAALCAGALVAPAAASAASPTSIVAGPLKVKDYKLTLSAIDGSKDSLSILLNRGAGKARQMHMYSFAEGVKIKTRKSLATTRIKASLGKYGKIDLKLKNAGATKRGATPPGCTGKAGKLRPGTLKGTFKLVADATYFKTISARSLKAQLAKGGSLECDGGGDGGGGGGGGTTGTTMLTSSIAGADGTLTFMATKDASGNVAQQAIRSDDPATAAPASITHMIIAPGTSSAFAPAADLSSATGTGVTPFFTGAFGFTADSAAGTMSMGSLSGDLAAQFDSIGTQQIAAGSPDAMLMGS
jgi:hypothetical protein